MLFVHFHTKKDNADGLNKKN